jgi:adenylate cyclase
VVAGVIGRKKFIYDLWGATVNLASRMESHGQSGAIRITRSTYDLVPPGSTANPPEPSR